MKRVLLPLLIGLLGAAAPGHVPDDPASLAWTPHLGGPVPLQARLRDEAGQTRTLARYFGHGPVILDIGYFHCPSLCGVTRDDLMAALAAAGIDAPYSVLAVSIDPAETPADAARTRNEDATRGANGAWHYLTGAAPALAEIEASVGFPARFDARFGQFMHPAGVTVLTASGIVSSYLLGVGYTPGDARAALLRAGGGGVARAALPILLLCFHYDPYTGRYTLATIKTLRLMALLTVGGIGVMLFLLHRPAAS